jgi:hypothetical protein
MPVYLVDRAVHGATMERLEVLRNRTAEMCRVVATQGKAIRYLRSTFAPGDSRCECLFEAANSELVRQVNDASGFAYERIMLAIDLGPVGTTEHVESTQCTKERN